MTLSAPSRPKLVIFDCDGVLVDSEPIAARVISAYLCESGWPMTASEADALFLGGTMAKVIGEARSRLPHLPEDAADQIYARMFQALETVEKIDGIDATLDALDGAGVAYAVGSNGPHEKIAVTLGATGLAARFEGRLFSARDVARPKPYPELFLLAAERCGAAPSECFVVGDSENDALAAEAAGMAFCGLSGHTRKAVFDALGADSESTHGAILRKILP